jgi:lysophospholipase L1-like esterase
MAAMVAGSDRGRGATHRHGYRTRAVLSLLIITVVFVRGVPADAVVPPAVPRSIAAIGDSLTRATDACCWYGDHPSQSWSTGYNPFGPVDSHLERLIALDPAIRGDEYNEAWAGARMADADAQATAVVSHGAQYVTISIGANDVCAPSASAMTPVEDFRGQFRAAMRVLESGLPDGAHVFVASIPNLLVLYRLFKDDVIARTIWRLFSVCQSVLSPQSTTAGRRAAHERLVAFNAVLSAVCASYPNCRFDGLAVFRYPFAAHEVSKLDYFHPNLSGQSALARVTWERSWWADQRNRSRTRGDDD